MDFLEGYVCGLGINFLWFMGVLDLLKLEEIGSNWKKYEFGFFFG